MKVREMKAREVLGILTCISIILSWLASSDKAALSFASVAFGFAVSGLIITILED